MAKRLASNSERPGASLLPAADSAARRRSRRRTRVFAALGELIVRVTTARTEREIFAAVSSSLVKMFQATRSSIALAVPDGLEVRALTGEAGLAPNGTIWPLNGSLIGRCFRTQRAVRWQPNPRSRMADSRLLAAQRLTWAMNAPITAGGNVIGTVNVGGVGAVVAADNVELLTQVGALIGANVDRLRSLAGTDKALAQLKAYTEKLEALNEIGLQLSTTMTEAEAFATIVAGFSRVTDARHVTYALREPDGAAARLFRADASGQPTVQSELMVELDGTALGRVLTTGATFVARNLQGQGHHHRVESLTACGSTIVLPIQASGETVGALSVCAEDDSLTEQHERALLTGFGRLMSATIERARLAERLAHQARHDPLTGLVNRRELDQRLEAVIGRARVSNARGCLLMLDLDHFKIINDTCGHHAGDALLKQVVGVLRSRISIRDTLARFGGDEFAVLLPDCELADGIKVGERLRAAIEDLSFFWEGKTFGVSLSMGLLELGPDVVGAAEAVADADAALYAAKDEGRNRVALATPTNPRVSERRGEAAWVARIRTALAQNTLALLGQPIAPASGFDGRLRFEVLLRMKDGDGALVLPGEFITAAERFNLIHLLDEWVVRTTLDRLARLPAAARKRLQLCTINLSAVSLEVEGFLGRLLELLGRVPWLAPKICFEITETAALAQPGLARSFIDAVSALGCQFALDDFGSGFTSFAHIKHLPVSILKIDGTLVRDIVIDPVDRSIADSIHQLAQTLGMQTVAEHVENEATLRELQAIGVDMVQGYGIGRPRPLEELLREPVERTSNGHLVRVRALRPAV
ncbi:MAG: EAL domain-containing protein [Chloroflexota bacterium]